MAKIVPMPLVQSMSGKLCTHSDVYFRTNKRNGRVCTGKLCYPSTKPATSDQLTTRTLFATAVANAKAIMAATSTDSVQTNYTKKVSYTSQYNANPQFAGTLFNFIMKKEFEVLQAED